MIARLIVWSALLLPVSFSVAQQASAAKKTSSFAQLSSQADAARDAERLDEAISLYRRALALRPAWAEGWWSLGTIYYDRDAYEKASGAFQKLVALRPSDGTAFAMLGLCEFELNRPEVALKHIEKGKSLGLQKNPDLWHVVLYHEGILLQRKGSFQAAQNTLEELCLQSGLSDPVANALGMAILRMNAAPAVGNPDGTLVVRVGSAECLAGQKKYDEARAAYEEIVNEYSVFSNVHYAYGLFLIELRDVPGAVAQFKQEIANHPDSVVSRLRIASIEYKEDSAAGLPYAEEAVKLDPNEPFGHYLLGLLRLDTGDYKKAIPELEIARKAFPQEARILLALATAYSRDGRKKDAAQARVTFQRLNDQTKAGTQAAGEARAPTNDAPPLPQ